MQTAWQKVQIARASNRKTSLDYIEKIFDEFIELHGDRNYRDDKAMVCGLARIGTQNYTVIAEQKGRNTKENIEEKEIVKIPNIKLNEKAEFSEIENKPFYLSNGNSYLIEKAIQTIQFELDKTGGKIRSEAGMMVSKTATLLPEELREFVIDDTFAIFLKENGKDKPYFAGKISDITKFQ